MTEESQLQTADCNIYSLPKLGLGQYVQRPEVEGIEYRLYSGPFLWAYLADSEKAKEAQETAFRWLAGERVSELPIHSPGEAACFTSVEVTIYLSKQEEAKMWLAQLPKEIVIPKPQEVTGYLSDHLDMNRVVLSVCETAASKFCGTAQLSLELFQDPESSDKHLTLYVRQENYNEDIMDIIEEIWEEHDKDFANMSGWLLVTTDFQPPK